MVDLGYWLVLLTLRVRLLRFLFYLGTGNIDLQRGTLGMRMCERVLGLLVLNWRGI